MSYIGIPPAAGPTNKRAWVNFNGTGTVAIRESWNVSSITDNGTGNYTVNFVTAMPDTNYSAVAEASRLAVNVATGDDYANISATNTGSIGIITTNSTFSSRSFSDFVYVAVQVIR